MPQTPLPSLFVSHGAPDMVLRDIASNRFLREAVATWPRPQAILVASAHFEAQTPTLTTDPSPETVYDFGRFDPALRAIRYGAPGAPDVSRKAAELLNDAGFEAEMLETRGFDHGVWTPLHLMYPDADIPVAQVSVSPTKGAAWHYRLGGALGPLREDGVLVLGSGAATHNLEAFFKGRFAEDATPPEWVDVFADWLRDRIEAGDRDALLRYRETAPHGAENHPTEEHLMPLFVAMGAAMGATTGNAIGTGAEAGSRAGRRLHTSTDRGVIKMDAYAFH